MSTINDAYMNLYNNVNDDADVIFVVHGQEVKAHKSIVIIRSEMLKRMIMSDLAPPDGRHLINDPIITAADFRNFLKFLYLDDCEIDYENIGALLHMSEMYFVPLLKEKCLEYVRHRCTTFYGLLHCCEAGITYENECPELIKICIEKFSKSCYASLTYNSRNGETQASAALVERIAKDCPRDHWLTENKLFVQIFEWGKEQCKQQNIPADPNGIQRVLSPIIKYMNLNNVSVHSWIHHIHPNGLAPEKECLKVFASFTKSCTDSQLDSTPKMLEEVPVAPIVGNVVLENVNDNARRAGNQHRGGGFVHGNGGFGYRGRGGFFGRY